MQLSTAPATDGAVHPGASEDPAAAPWRAGVWTAARAAATALGKDPTDATFRAAPGGPVDGAAASALLAAGFLATLTGARIDPTATLTGALLPDGSLGPVPGLPEQFEAALAQGKKQLGYPSGVRLARSAETGELVDLGQLAKEAGAQAIEIADVHAAYKLLTGRALPQAVPVPAADMALDAPTTQALAAAYREGLKRLAGVWAMLFQLQQGGNLPGPLTAMARHAQLRGEEAERLHRRGAVAAAHGKLVEAWAYAASAVATFDVLQQVQQGQLDGALATLDQLAQLAETREALQQLGATRPSTLGGHLQLLAAQKAALRAWTFQAAAAGELEGARRHLAGLAGQPRPELTTPRTADALVAAVAPAILLLGRARALALEAREAPQRFAHETAQTLPYTCAPEAARRLAASLLAAAAAGAAHVDALLVEPLARSAGVPLEQARVRAALTEPDALVAHALSQLPAQAGLPQELKQAWGEGSPAWQLTSLAAGELASAASAELIAKLHSLQVRTDFASGPRATALHEQALAALLARAERAARASARAARIAAGTIPVHARLAYQTARVKQEGSAADKLEALAAYWQSSAASQTAVMLARN